MLAAVRGLLEEARPAIAARGITLLGVTVANLDGEEESGQLTLPLEDPAGAALDAALDRVRDRFGPTAVTRASLLGHDPGLASWLLPGGRRDGPGARRPAASRRPPAGPRP